MDNYDDDGRRSSLNDGRGNNTSLEKMVRILMPWYGEIMKHLARQDMGILQYQEAVRTFSNNVNPGASAPPSVSSKRVNPESDIFKMKQDNTEMLREWMIKAFTKGLNPSSSDASLKLKESLLEF
ncbi:hypothetical protein HAX54_039633 [Datura stramonium]|uniref:Uncharacterized protein n=1 Tax=Datura stramonium TaxID=4076 RepID=A0ABS8VQW6_DATST|nr:hypothetical protein [Datura stramonium]